jgi:flavodoxin
VAEFPKFLAEEVLVVRSVVIYGSRYGNTQKVAEAIADGLRSRGPVELISVDHGPTVLAATLDMLVVGGPTEAHGMTDPVRRFLEGLGAGSLESTAAAAFDTRLRLPRWVSGSAATGIARRLEQAGARLVAPAESFFVKGKDPALEPGELERAAAWGRSLAPAARRKRVVSNSPEGVQ